MTVRDQRTLDVVDEVSRTADRLARRMGGQYVLDCKWRNALDEQQRDSRSAGGPACGFDINYTTNRI